MTHVQKLVVDGLVIARALPSIAAAVPCLQNPTIDSNPARIMMLIILFPSRYGLGLDGVDKATMFAEFKKTKEASLYYINFRGFIVWGIIMHLALFNLMTAGSGGSIGGDDALVFQFCMAVAAVVVGAGLILICCLNSNGKRANKKRQNGKDPDGEESDEDAEESDKDAESSDEDDFTDEE